ncbi:MAG: hypothetical protein ACREFX_08235 [Opitutaceae bacterium]
MTLPQRRLQRKARAFDMDTDVDRSIIHGWIIPGDPYKRSQASRPDDADIYFSA